MKYVKGKKDRYRNINRILFSTAFLRAQGLNRPIKITLNDDDDWEFVGLIEGHALGERFADLKIRHFLQGTHVIQDSDLDFGKLVGGL